MKLNLGCGNDLRKDYLNVDTEDTFQYLDIHGAQWDNQYQISTRPIFPLDWVPFNSVESILALDVLEHFEEPREVLDDWLTKLKVGGSIIICCPDYPTVWEHLLSYYRKFTPEIWSGFVTDGNIHSTMFGLIDNNPLNRHSYPTSFKEMKHWLLNSGNTTMEVSQQILANKSEDRFNFTIKATKVKDTYTTPDQELEYV